MERLSNYFYLIMLNLFLLFGCSNHAPFSPMTTRSISEISILTQNPVLKSLNKTLTVTQQISANEGGFLNLEIGTDLYLLDIIQNPGDIKIKNEIIINSPVSPSVLIAMLEMPNPLSSGDTKKVLIKNSPLRTCVLEAFLDYAPHYMSTGDLKAVLAASSPLPPEILEWVDDVGLSKGDLRTVMEAHVGTRPNDSELNVGTNGMSVNLQLLPHAIIEDTWISMSLENNQIAGDVYVSFGPHGTLFNPAAILNVEITGLDLSDLDPTVLDIYYINPNTGYWELLQRDDVIVRQNEGYIKVVNALLPHFSRYAIGMD